QPSPCWAFEHLDWPWRPLTADFATPLDKPRLGFGIARGVIPWWTFQCLVPQIFPASCGAFFAYIFAYKGYDAAPSFGSASRNACRSVSSTTVRRPILRAGSRPSRISL